MVSDLTCSTFLWRITVSTPLSPWSVRILAPLSCPVLKDAKETPNVYEAVRVRRVVALRNSHVQEAACGPSYEKERWHDEKEWWHCGTATGMRRPAGPPTRKNGGIAV